MEIYNVQTLGDERRPQEFPNSNMELIQNDFGNISISLRAIVKENRADLKDRGRPIPSIFWLCNKFHQAFLFRDQTTDR